MQFNHSKFTRLLKIAVRLVYIFVSFWVIGALIFSVEVEHSLKYFSKVMWWLLICLIGNVPDILVSNVNGFIGRVIVIVFSVLGLILVSVLIGNVASFAIEGLLKNGGPIQKYKVKKQLYDHVVFMGWNKESLSVVQEIRSSDFVEDIPIVIITNREVDKGEYRSALSRFSNVFWIKSSPFAVSSWGMADLKFARSIYLSFEETFSIEESEEKYFTALSKVLCNYLEAINSSAFIIISVRNNSDRIDIACDRMNIIREESYSDDIISSTIISPMTAKIINSMIMHSAKSELYIYDISSKDVSYKNIRTKLKRYLSSYNIDLIGYGEYKKNSNVYNLKSSKIPEFQYIDLDCSKAKNYDGNENNVSGELCRLVLLARSEKDIKSSIKRIRKL